MDGFDNLEGVIYELVKSISDLRIGDEICKDQDGDKVYHSFVVALFAEAGTLGFQPEDFKGTIYGDFPDNPGDVLEFRLEEDSVFKIKRINLSNNNTEQLCG